MTEIPNQKVKVSPKLLKWIQRNPSNRMAVHQDRWNAVPKEQGDVVEEVEENESDL